MGFTVEDRYLHLST